MRTYKAALCVFGILLFFFFSCNERRVLNDEKHDIFESSPLLEEENIDKYTPFFWGYTANDDFFKDANLLNSTSYFHPLDIGRKALFAIHVGVKENDSTLLGYGKKYLDFLLDYPYVKKDSTSIVYKYSFAHNEFVAGEWWSGMANSVIALAFLEGYEAFEDTVYFENFQKAINGVIELVEDGGSAIEFANGERWYQEYVDTNRNSENSYFVLNGFLFSLLAIDIIAEKTEQEVYFDAYNQGVNAFLLLKDKFITGNGYWTNYMLNPLTIESTHYSIYDVLLFKSLLTCTYNSVFDDEILKRQNILLSEYPIYKKETRHNTVFLFSSIGPPHPYWIDTYQVELRYYSGDSLMKKHCLPEKDFAIPIINRAFLLDTFSIGEIDNVGVFALYNSDTLNLYKVSVDRIKRIEDFKAISCKYDKLTMLNMKMEDDSKLNLIMPDDFFDEFSRGTIRLLFKNALDVNKNRLFGLTFQAARSIDNMMITLIDGDGNSATRYYIAPKPDEPNLLLFNKLGFKNIESLNCNDISEFRIDVYAKNSKESDDIAISLGDFICFENNFQLFEYFNTNSFHFPEKEKRGNIY